MATIPPIQFGEVFRAIKDSRENVVYYRRQKALSTQPGARAHFGALATLWQSNLTALEKKAQQYASALKP